MGRYYVDSKVEITGFGARYYDVLLNLFTLGKYKSFIKKAAGFMQIKKKDVILDLGAGTGRNACLMRSYLSNNGRIIGIDISQEMTKQFNKKCSRFPNMNIIFSRADKGLPFKSEVFDKVLTSFLIHGFPQDIRENIIEEVHRVLKNRGKLFILDYNQFLFEESSLYIRILFKLIECPYAFDFIKRDWKVILFNKKFDSFKEKLFFKNYVRILEATKKD